MASFPESGIRLIVDTSEAESAVSDLQSQLDDLQGGDYSATVTAEVDTSALDGADLPTEDTEVTETINTDVQPADDNSSQILNTLKSINAKETFSMIVDIAGTAIDFFKTVGQYSLDPILQLGDAVAEVGAKTGEAIPNADKLINKIFYDDLGKSKEEVAKMIITAHGLGLPIEEATRAALTFTHTWSDVDSTQAITTFGTLLKTNLVGNMQQASDLMSVFFQQGGNKGGDALQVVNANAESWSNMGLTAQQALSTISTLLKGNVDNATDAAKMIQTMDDNLTTAAANADSPQAKMLGTMGLENPKEKGQAMGADFINGFAAAFTNLPADQQDLASGLFMGKGGKKFTGAIEGMTSSSDMFKNVTDAAKIAADEIDNSFHGAINDFILQANKALEDFLSSTAIDIPGKIDKLKQGLQDGMKVLADGGSLSEGLTVALKPLGFDDEFQGLESMLGNFVIALLQIVATLQDVAGHGDEAAGTRGLIAKQGATQLSFDLKIANPDEIATDISTATSRGLSQAQIADTISGVIAELIKTGTADSLAQAQKLVDTLKAPVDQNKLPTLASGAPMNVEPVVTDEAITNLQGQIDTALKQAPQPDTIDQLSVSMGLMNDATVTAKNSWKLAHDPLTGLGTASKMVGDNAKNANKPIVEQAQATYTVAASATAAVNPLLNFGNTLDTIGKKANALSAATDHVAEVQGTLPKDQQADPGKHAAGGNFTGTGIVGDAGPELVSSNTGLSVWNNATTNAFLQAMQQYVPGGSGGSSQVNNTIVNNNNVPNIATADALGYKQAATLRGASNN